jgi:REP element-mobilizing transposase RayT
MNYSNITYVTNEGQLIAINGMPDHVHILIGLKPNKALSDLVRDIKPIHQDSLMKSMDKW